MGKVKKLLSNPTVRLLGRALVAGITAAVVLYQNNDDTTWQALIVAGVLAAAEFFTPLNALVGLFKHKPT